MADIGTGQHWLVTPNAEVEKQWLRVQINERISRIRGTESAIDDLEKIQKERLKGNLMMLQIELKKLQEELSTLDGKVVDAEVKEG
jgi:hypothetical protein